MDVTVHLEPEVERNLAARAEQQGLSIDEYIQELVDREAHVLVASGTGGNRSEEFLQWVNGHRDNPPLSDDAISRASLNPDRW